MILCGLHEHPDSSAAVAYSVWLGERLHTEVRLCAAAPTDGFLAAAESHDARLLVVAGGASEMGSGEPPLALVNDSPRPVVVLSERAATPWRVPHRAGSRPLIVVGLDGSEPSLAATAAAADLVGQMDSWLVLVHASQNPVPHGANGSLPSSVDLLSELDDSASRLGARVLAEFGRDGSAAVRRVFGDPVEALDEAASGEAAAMIAVGSHGLGWDRLALSGSVCAALLHTASRPVLVLSPKAVARTIAGLTAPPIGRCGRVSLGVGPPAKRAALGDGGERR